MESTGLLTSRRSSFFGWFTPNSVQWLPIPDSAEPRAMAALGVWQGGTMIAHGDTGYRTRVCSQAPPPLPRTLLCQEALSVPTPPDRKVLRSPGHRPAPGQSDCWEGAEPSCCPNWFACKGRTQRVHCSGLLGMSGVIHAPSTHCPGRARDAPRRPYRVLYPHGPGESALLP